MTFQTITSKLTSSYTLSGSFTGLSLTTTGVIQPSAAAAGAPGAVGLAMPNGGTLIDHGHVYGGLGGGGVDSSNYIGLAGGVGVDIAGVGVANTFGLIVGGTGGAGHYSTNLGHFASYWSAGGTGGTGLATSAGVYDTNSGSIVGGHGGNGANGKKINSFGNYYETGSGNGGNGGWGVSLAAGGTINNIGTILGGDAGNGGGGTLYTIVAYTTYLTGNGGNGGNGGAGVYSSGAGVVLNYVSITGGRYGTPGYAPMPGTSGAYGTMGAGVEMSGGTVVNGSYDDAGAFIAGNPAVSFGTVGGALLVNYGLIKTTNYVKDLAIYMGANSRLVIEPGSGIVGQSQGSTLGANATLELAGGRYAGPADSIYWPVSQDVTITTPTSSSDFLGFQTLAIDGKVELSVDGFGTVGEGYGVILRGILDGVGGLTTQPALGGRPAAFIDIYGGSLTVATLVNSGTVSGYGVVTGKLFQYGGAFIATSGHTLSLAGAAFAAVKGGVWEAQAGAVLQMPDYQNLSVLNSTAILGGAGAVIQELNTIISHEVTLDAALTSITASGTLEVGYGRNFAAANPLHDAGQLLLSGGTVSGGALTLMSGGLLGGNGEVDSNVTVLAGGGIEASGGGLTLLQPSHAILNKGLLEGTGGGQLRINGAVVTNTGGTVLANSGGIALESATINGGTVSITATGALYAGPGGLNTSTVAMGGATITSAGLIHTNSQGTLVFSHANLAMAGGEMLAGSDYYGGSAINLYDSSVTDGSIIVQSGSTLVASGASDTVTLHGGTITNAGTLETQSKSHLTINSTVIQNAGGALIAQGFGGVITLDVVSVRGAGVIGTQASGGAGCEIVIGDSSIVEVQGAVSNAGTIAIASSTINTDLRILAGGATLSGGGKVILSGTKGRILGATAASTLTNVDNTISGMGFLGANSLTLVNQSKGVIDAVGAFGLTVGTKGETLTNQGLMEASGGGILAIVGTTVVNVGGTLMASNLSPVKLQDSVVRGGSIIATGSGVIKFNVSGGDLDGTTSAVSLSGVAFIVNGSNETLVGSIVNAGKINLIASTSTSDLIIGAAGATLSGGGQVNMTNSLSNRIYGLASGDTLTNVDNRIDGAGVLGNGTMTLNNAAKGQIVGNQNFALTIDTGVNTILNAGLIENVGKGGTLVKSAVANTGTLLAATAGTLNFAGTVTGAGIGQIAGGTLYVQKAYAENVTFSGTTGVLELGDSQAYTGKVTGLSKTGTSWLDLVDIGFFSTKTKATYSGTTASGTLTVTDGTHTAHIALVGNYLGSTWTVSGDGHGGTKVVDPSGSAAPLSQAMASFTAGPAPQPAHAGTYVTPRLSILHAQA